jgi:hypothetical protein
VSVGVYVCVGVYMYMCVCVRACVRMRVCERVHMYSCNEYIQGVCVHGWSFVHIHEYVYFGMCGLVHVGM